MAAMDTVEIAYRQRTSAGNAWMVKTAEDLHGMFFVAAVLAQDRLEAGR